MVRGKKDTRVVLMMTSREKDKLRKIAEHYDYSMSQVVRMMLRRKVRAMRKRGVKV